MCLQTIFLVRAKRPRLLKVRHNYLPFSMQHHFIACESENGRKIEVFDNFIRHVLSPDRNWDILMAEPTSG